MAQKSMQKCIIFLMPLGIDFWVDFGAFWVPKSSQVDAKMGSKINVNSERRVCKKYFFPKEKLSFFGSKASKLRAKTDQKSIKKWSPRWNASWHRF